MMIQWWLWRQTFVIVAIYGFELMYYYSKYSQSDDAVGEKRQGRFDKAVHFLNLQ